MRFKLKLTCPVEVTATAEITVEGEDMDEIYGRLEQILDDIDKKEAKVMDAHHRDPVNVPYPERLIYWTVEPEDVENEINNKLADIEDSEEVET